MASQAEQSLGKTMLQMLAAQQSMHKNKATEI